MLQQVYQIQSKDQYMHELANICEQGDRSMNELIQMMAVQPNELNNILKNFAIHIKNENCMETVKHLVILLGQVLQNDLKAYEALKKINRTFQIQKMLEQNDKLLNLTLYQFDCLVATKLPKLYLHFLEREIKTSNIWAQWITTLFTKYIKIKLHESAQIDENLLQFWDQVICADMERRWSPFFKLSLYMLKLNQERILQM